MNSVPCLPYTVIATIKLIALHLNMTEPQIYFHRTSNVSTVDLQHIVYTARRNV